MYFLLALRFKRVCTSGHWPLACAGDRLLQPSLSYKGAARDSAQIAQWRCKCPVPWLWRSGLWDGAEYPCGGAPRRVLRVPD